MYPALYIPGTTYSTLVAGGMSAAAGALSSPMLEQLTTQDGWGPASVQLQLTGQGLQLLPLSPCGPEPHASRQQSATSRLEKKLNLGTQTPCFRLDKVCPFPQGIAHSHLIASDGVSPLRLGRKHTGQRQTHASFSHGFHVRRQKEKKGWTFSRRYLPCVFSFLLVGSPSSSENLTELLHSPFRGKKSFGELPPSSSFHWMHFPEPPLVAHCSVSPQSSM